MVPLTPKLLDLLLHLIDHAGALVTKEALLEALWPGANVTDNALAQAVSDLRDALGDEPKSPQFIKTVARRGYRFIARVETVDVPQSSAASPASSPGARDTASLDAYRAMMEGSLRLESLMVEELPRAIDEFERAVSIDAALCAGLRGPGQRRARALRDHTIGQRAARRRSSHAPSSHARRAVELDESLAEAHATLALVLVSAGRKTLEAASAARRAVSIEPSNWRHLFRLGSRVRGARSACAPAPACSRSTRTSRSRTFRWRWCTSRAADLRDAETVLRHGAAVQDRQIGRGGRYPGARPALAARTRATRLRRCR